MTRKNAAKGFFVRSQTPSQSAPTILVYQFDLIFFRVWKKSGPKYGSEKSRVQKSRVIVIQKEKRQPGLFSFWITMTLFFAPCFFQVHILGLDFFQGQKPTHVFKTRIVGADWLGESLFLDLAARYVSETINNLGTFSFQSIRVVTRNHYRPVLPLLYCKMCLFFTILGIICPFPVPFVLQPCWFNFLFLVRLHFDCCLNMLPTLHSAILEKINI